MGVATTTARVSYDGNGSSTAFSFGYKYIQSSDLVVYVYDEDDDSIVTQVLSTNYTVTPTGAATNGVYPGATITFSTAPGADKKVVIFRKTNSVQEFDFDAENDPLPILTRHADLEVMRQQANNDHAARSLRLPEGDYQTINALPTKNELAGHFLAFDGSGDPIASDGGIESVPVSTALEPLVGASSLKKAQAVLFGASDSFASTLASESLISITDVTVSAGDLTYDLTLGDGAGSLFPDAGLAGSLSQAKWISRSYVASEFNDGIDWWSRTALGTRDAPTAHTISSTPYLASRYYYTPYDGTAFMVTAANSHYPSSAVYTGVGAEINTWLVATPSQTARSCAFTFSTANATQTPIDRVAVRHDGKCIFYGNAYEMSGISYPHAPGNIQESRMPITGANFFDYSPPAGNTFLAGDLQSNSSYLAMALMSLAAPTTEGVLVGINRTDVEAQWYRRSGSTTNNKYMAVTLNSGLMALGYPGSGGGREALRVVPRSSADCSFTVTAGNSSNILRYEPVGSGSNYDMREAPKGTGILRKQGPVQFESTNSAGTRITTVEELLSAVSGATVTTSASLIPAGATVIDVTTRITTALGTGSGTTGYNVGDGSDADRFGVAAAVTLGTTTTLATADPRWWSASARGITITAVGGNFNGTGAIRVAVTYSSPVAPTA